jgi:hypothetical protein
MPSLPDELFSLVERKVLEARSAAEAAAEAAINALAVNRAEPFRSLSPEQRRLRNALRARARQLGGGSQVEGLKPLVEEIAYQQWHRMLFARFLAENGLLMHPDGIPVTLQDCAELAPEEGEPDAWSLAARYAGAMLPGIFRPDDPVVQVRFAPEGRLALERILAELPSLAFTADDSLGWMYQFWQSQKKAEVNASERKIGGADIAPVTQLFTEDYMVRFLLENTLGAWWAARHPDSPLVKTFTYLRFREDGTPAAGTFPGWPDRAAEITVMDPCCGSGHFLVVAFLMLWLMRMEEEGLDEAAAADAVLRDNLFGLEIDPRCTQIAAFALALVAWKVGGYRELPLPNVACSGIPVQGQLETWSKLAGEDVRLRTTLERLYELFRNAPDLGSLINPAEMAPQDLMFSLDYSEVEPLLQTALKQELGREDDVAGVFGAAAAGAAKVSSLLARRYVLVATNVPYLTRNKQDIVLRRFCDQQHPSSKRDLATAFVSRCQAYAAAEGTYAVASPQSWLFQPAYKKMRKEFIEKQTWNLIGWLGEHGFRSSAAAGAFAVLLILTDEKPPSHHRILGIDASALTRGEEKADSLRRAPLRSVSQISQLDNPDARVLLDAPTSKRLLMDYADSRYGLRTGDFPRFGRTFWEVPRISDEWTFQQSTVSESVPYGGREQILYWQKGQGELKEFADLGKASIQGGDAWGKQGVVVCLTRSLPCTLYTGEIFDNNVAVIWPFDESHLAALWEYCRSTEFYRQVRRIDKTLKVMSKTLLKIPFDLEHWQAVAAKAGPLPQPESNDPSQWLFDGHPVAATEPLQVAVARLLGYRWPLQESDNLHAYVNEGGIVCLSTMAGEQAASQQLRALLAAAYGDLWSPSVQDRVLSKAGHAGESLVDWLRDTFFERHCQLFRNRPFIWHIWDGRRDGFSALVNYHKLDSANLNKLIYTYLGNWIRVQRSLRDAGEAGAEGCLVAALELQKKLEAIRDGEPPYDIYVRWKPLHEQSIGWNPDLNDGVRLNIRPFVTAGVLRNRFTIHWRKDRGKNLDGSERHNDRHYTVAEKQEARRQWAASHQGQATKKQRGQS